MNRSNRLSVLPVCRHGHTREHVEYHTGEGDTAFDDDTEETYEYTLRHRLVVCVNCLFVINSTLTRVIYVVMPKHGTNIVKAYNFKSDAEEYAKYVDGYWVEAELAGGM